MSVSELYTDWANANENGDLVKSYVYREYAESWLRAKQPALPAAKELRLDNESYTSEQRARPSLGHEFDELVAGTDYLFSNPQARAARENMAELPKMRAYIDSVAADARRELPGTQAQHGWNSL